MKWIQKWLQAPALLFLSALAAQDAAASEYIFSHVADGRSPGLGYVTSFQLNNVSANTNEINLSFYRSNGSAWIIDLRSRERGDISARSSTFRFVLNAGETVNLFSAAADPIATGWARVQSTEPLNISEIFSSLNPDVLPQKIGWEAGVLPMPVAARFSFEANYSADDLIPGTLVNTGYAIANPSGNPITITATLYSRNGAQLSQRLISLPARGQVAEFMNQRFGDVLLPSSFHGLIRLSSDGNIAVSALRMSSAPTPSGDLFSTVAVNPEFSLGYHIYNDQEPNNTRDTAQPISLPAEIIGSKNAGDSGTDPDYFSVNLRANQTIYVIGVADVIGSDLDIDIYLRDAGGNQLRFVVNWGSTTRDALFSQQVIGAGTYYIQVVGGTGASSGGASYRLFLMAR